MDREWDRAINRGREGEKESERLRVRVGEGKRGREIVRGER